MNTNNPIQCVLEQLPQLKHNSIFQFFNIFTKYYHTKVSFYGYFTTCVTFHNYENKFTFFH